MVRREGELRPVPGGEGTHAMTGGVAIVTDSASDLTPVRAAAAGIALVPLLVRFGEREFQHGVDLTAADFYRRLAEPGAPFPTTAAAGPGTFRQVFDERLDAGAASVVCLTVGGKLSASLTSAEIARDALPAGTVRVVDTETASMAQGLLALLAADLAREGADADRIVETVERRRADASVFVVLHTLDYLKRGGRISAARAAIGSLLSIKPIITIRNGEVEVADRPRTGRRARERLVELITAAPLDRIEILHAQADDVEGFAGELAAIAGIDRGALGVDLIGPSVAAHVGPGAYGAGILIRRA